MSQYRTASVIGDVGYIWYVQPCLTEHVAAAALSHLRDRIALWEYALWCYDRGRRPAFDFHDSSGQINLYRLRALGQLTPDEAAYLATGMRDGIRLLRACRVPYTWWNDPVRWNVAVGALEVDWSGTDRQLVEAVTAATAEPY
jgi:hypothetical protein